MIKIFVYGTLKKKCRNHNVLKEVFGRYYKNIKIKKVKTKNKYPMFKTKYNFPFLIKEEGVGFNIFGELYETKHEIDMNILDEFEGVPELFKRGKITVIDENNNEYKDIEVYFCAEDIKNYKNKKLIEEWIE